MDEILTITDEEYLRISATLRNSRNMDLSYYQPVIAKHRITRFAQARGFSNISLLIQKLQTDKVFADMLISEIKVPTTEMFRDPQTWTEIHQILSEKLSQESIIKIWLPDICGDDELNTILVLLSQCRMLHKTMVYATSSLNSCINKAQAGYVDAKKYEASEANFKRMDERNKLEEYVTRQDAKYYEFSPTLLQKTIYLKQNIISDPAPDNGFNMIILRNRMLYYNNGARKKIIDNISKSLIPGGYLALGVGENLNGLDPSQAYSQVSKTEKIFRKK